MHNEVEVMRIIRVPPMGALVVHADGGRFTQLAAVQNAQTRQRLLAAIGELVTFAGGYNTLVEAGLAPPLTGATGAPATGRDDRRADEELSQQQAAFLHQLEKELRGQAASDFADRPVLQETYEAPSPPGASLVSEIDLILQRHLATDERLAQRSIHLRQPPGQILQIVVDGKVYKHPNEIEDPHVKAVLKRALKEWESR